MDLFSAVPLFRSPTSLARAGYTGAWAPVHLTRILFHHDSRSSGVVRLYLDYSFEMAIEAGRKSNIIPSFAGQPMDNDRAAI